MDIPINARVECADGPCGRSTFLIIDPTKEQVTHLVVQEQEAPHTERLVPIELVLESTPQGIRLRCSRDALNSQDPFKIQEFVRSTIPHYQGGAFMAWPFAVPETRTELLEIKEEAISKPVTAITERTTRISDGLENAQQNLSETQTNINNNLEAISSIKARIPGLIDLLSITLSFVYLWIAFGQVALIVFTWNIIKAPEETENAAENNVNNEEKE